MSTLPERENTDPQKPLQFSVRFALGVVTAVVLFCAAGKTIGEPFWAVALPALVVSSLLPTVLVVFNLAELMVMIVLPGDRDRKAANTQFVCRALMRSLLWCLSLWFLVFLSAGLAFYGFG